MDEQKEEEKEETTNDADVRGDQYEGIELIDRANEAAKRLEQANEKQEELLTKEEQLMAKRALGGKGEAGTRAAKKEPESDLEYSKRVARGEANPLAEDGFV